MIDFSKASSQIHQVSSFQNLITTPFHGQINAMCWTRTIIGDFAEIVEKLEKNENIATVDLEELRDIKLSEQGELARQMLLNDFESLQAHGASPVLNIISHYDKDVTNPFFPTDVYSFHVDRSPIPTSTFLCTYLGDPSEILPNDQGIQKILIPEIRSELQKQFRGSDADFETYLSDNFFDLHYQAKPGAHAVSLGQGHLWRLAVDHPDSKVLPCIHRAPLEKSGQPRLLLIC